MGKALIVSEKPDVARTIARVLEVNEKKEGYFQNGQYYVTFLFGHFLTLYDMVDYGQQYEKWSMDNLPFIPQEFKYKFIPKDGIEKQFKVVEKLLNSPDVDYVINACDGDVEANVLFDEVFRAAGCNKTIKRLWVSSHTPEDLKKGLQNFKSPDEDAALTRAGYVRQHTDWIFGINYSISTTLTFGNNTVLKVGRVILPTVNLIYRRDMEIKNFVPEPYYELLATFKTDRGLYDGFLMIDKQTKFMDKDQLSEIFKKVQGKSGVVTQVTIDRGTKAPGHLFSLGDLQGEVASHYKGFSADKVLRIAQGLYEKQFITYPRTASRYADNSQVESVQKTLDSVKSFFQDFKFTFKQSKSIFDSSKVESHPAIMPTYLVPKGLLSADEQIVYMEIVKRFLAQFAPPAEFEKTDAITEVNGFQFRTQGKIWISRGWMELYGKDVETEEPELKFQLKEKMKVETIDLNVMNKESKPPAHYTVKTLLSAMENCGDKSNLDESLILRGYTLGRPSSRAEILKKIEQVGYVTLKNSSYLITDMGIQLIELFPIHELIEPEFTGKFEKKLYDISQRTYSSDVFMKEVQDSVVLGIEKFKQSKGTITKKDQEKIGVGKCPVCGKDVLEYPKGFGCSGFKDGCKFFIWKDNALLKRYEIKSVSKSLVKELLANQRSEIKLGNTLVPIVLDQKDNHWNLRFSFDEGQVASLGKCPECGCDIIETPKGFSCLGYKTNGCKFVLWKDDFLLGTYGKKVSVGMVKNFLSKQVCAVKGLIDPHTKDSFDGEIQLVKNDKGFWGFRIHKKIAS